MCICNSQGMIEDVSVNVEKFVFLAYFMIMDFNIDEDTDILLERPFLAAIRTLIHVEIMICIYQMSYTMLQHQDQDIITP